MKKGSEEGATPSNDAKDEKVLTNEIGRHTLKDCASDIGCGEPDASAGWRAECKHQRVTAAIPLPGA